MSARTQNNNPRAQVVKQDEWGRTTLLIQPHGARKNPDAGQLKCAMWNVNGLGDKRGYIKQLLTDYKLDVLILTETERTNAIYPYSGLDCYENEYRAIQILSTVHNRGGVVIFLKKILRI